MELSTLRVEIGGVASQANEFWMAQMARNLTDDTDGFFKKKRYLIHDRDPLYTRDFLNLLADAGIESVKLPPRSPNLIAKRVRIYNKAFLRQTLFAGSPCLHLFGEQKRGSTESRSPVHDRVFEHYEIIRWLPFEYLG